MKISLREYTADWLAKCRILWLIKRSTSLLWPRLQAFIRVFKWSVGEISGDKKMFQCSEDKHGLYCLCQAKLMLVCFLMLPKQVLSSHKVDRNTELHLVTHSCNVITSFGASIWIPYALVTPELQPWITQLSWKTQQNMEL